MFVQALLVSTPLTLTTLSRSTTPDMSTSAWGSIQTAAAILQQACNSNDAAVAAGISSEGGPQLLHWKWLNNQVNNMIPHYIFS